MHNVRTFTHEEGILVHVYIDKLYSQLAPEIGQDDQRGFTLIEGHEKNVVWSAVHRSWMEPAYLDHVMSGHFRTEAVRKHSEHTQCSLSRAIRAFPS